MIGWIIFIGTLAIIYVGCFWIAPFIMLCKDFTKRERLSVVLKLHICLTIAIVIALGLVVGAYLMKQGV